MKEIVKKMVKEFVNRNSKMVKEFVNIILCVGFKNA